MYTADMSVLQQGKRDFKAGYYRRAMRELLPLACDGYAEAQYAVGYMYYYGNGVTQDTEVGYFWIKRAADQGFVPAEKALEIVKN
ncbi:MAG: sel1 repeat family protein [Gammaproteobacteria bacterium]|nr:MAG: sel1 repeat family protein [Gammaproteobacteria bacterium]